MSKSSRATIGLILLVLVCFVTGAPGVAEQIDPPKKTDKPDPKVLASDKRLAERMMPTAEELKANGDWKLPWNCPAGMKIPLAQVDRDGYPTLYRKPLDRYWESRAYPGFFRASPADVVKRIEDATKQLKEIKNLEGDAISTMKGVYMIQELSLQWFPAEITTAVVGLKFMTEKETRFTLWRASKWDDVIRIADATQAVWDIVRKYNKDVGEVPGGQLAFLAAETFKDPDWQPANKRLSEALGGSDNELDFMRKHEIGWTSAVVNVRQIHQDALDEVAGKEQERLLKDLTEEDAKRLQEKINSALKAEMDVVTPIIEKQLQYEQASIKKLKDQGFPTNLNEEALAFKQQAWKNFPAPTVKLQRRTDIGAADCHVVSTFTYLPLVSTDLLGKNSVKAYLHTATLRNGVYIADVLILSTMSEEESKKDLDFLLRVLQQRTTTGREGVTTGSKGGSAP